MRQNVNFAPLGCIAMTQDSLHRLACVLQGFIVRLVKTFQVCYVLWGIIALLDRTCRWIVHQEVIKMKVDNGTARSVPQDIIVI